MSSAPYRPRADSLASQCIGFFTNNPDEQLTLDDITDKFDAVRGNIHTLLKPAVDACLITRAADDEMGYLYSAGVDLARWAPATTPSAPVLRQSSAHRHRQPRTVIDIEKLQVRTDIPYPFAKSRAGGNKWAPLFAKLQMPGECLPIPVTVVSAVKAAANKQNKLKLGTFRAAQISDTEAYCWRLS